MSQGLLVTSEDVERDHVNLGVAVLASLGGGHLHDLGGSVLQEKTRYKLSPLTSPSTPVPI